MKSLSTAATLIIGLMIAAVACIPIYSWVLSQEPGPKGLNWAGAGMSYMGTFFHELGHTIAAWFYGYPTLPMFDFTHGGGFALHTGFQPLVVGGVWALLAYGIFFWRDVRPLQILLAGLLLLNLGTIWSEDLRTLMITAMGPGAEILIGTFLLFRALFDLAPRGDVERVLNAVFGFGLIFAALIDSYGLLHNPVHRTLYYNQKGSHGFGDFDKIEDALPALGFEEVIYIRIVLTLLCLTLPFALFALMRAGRAIR
ncbi:MAG: hypothetical protein R3D66_07070 [Alphaproteobacteria bacterium]